MKYLILTTLTIITCYTFAQSQQATGKAPVVNAAADVHPQRFDIFQSPSAARATFKLDTYLGDVYLLVVDSTGVNLWQRMLRTQSFAPDTWYPNTRNYSIFVSSIGIKFTYLINVNTGTTWQLTEDTNTKALFFSPMTDK